MKSSSHSVLAYLRSVVARQDAAENDGELLRRLVERRDEEAFTVLLQRHGPMVLSLARRVAGDEQTAEDVFQAAFLWLFRKGHTIRRPHALSCWLHGVAHRLALQARRAHGRRRRQEALARTSSSPNPLDELTAQEFLAVLDEELAKLPEKVRAPLILCCLEGLSQEEAARRLGCSSDAVRGRLERGRQRLRMRLEKRGMTLPAVLGGTLLLAGAPSPVSAALEKMTLQVATTGGAPSPAVAALIEEAMRMTFINKCKAIGVVGMLLALSGTGVGMIRLHPQAVPESAPLAAADDKALSAKKHVDLYGDPLPDGAIMRLGTLQRRAVNATLAVSADGKSIVGVRGGKGIRIWDALTGALRQTRELPGELWGPSVLSRDGRSLARVVLGPDYRLEIWNIQNGKKLHDWTIKGGGHIMPVAFSADGKHVAAVANRRTIEAGVSSEAHAVRAWDIETGKEIFAADVRSIGSGGELDFAPDGKRILASFNSADAGTYCWDLGTGRLLWQNKKFYGQPFVCTPDGKLLSRNLSPTVDLIAGRKVDLAELPPSGPDTSSWTIAPNGQILLVANSKGAIVWDLKEGKELRTLPGAGEAVVFTPDSKTVISNNGALQRWDLATGKAVWLDTSDLGHVGEVAVVRFSADGKRLVSGSTDGTVRLWDAATGRPLRVWRGHQGARPIRVYGWAKAGVKTIDISADGRRVASAGTEENLWKENLRLWDLASDKEFRTISLPPTENGEWGGQFYHVRISPDGRQVVGIFGPTGGSVAVGQPMPKLTDKLALWDAATGNLLEMQAVEMHGGGVFSSDGQTLLAGNNLIDVRSGKIIAKLPNLHLNGWGGSSAFSSDGALIIAEATKEWKKGMNYVGSDGLRVWEAATGKIVARLKTESWIAQTAFHPDNRYFVTNNLDGIRLRDVRDGHNIAHFTMPESIRAGTTFGSYANCMAFSRDGRRMATGMPDGTILVWNVSLPPAKNVELSVKELETLWADLADADAAKAWRAVGRLADGPKEALSFLGGRVKPYPTASADVMGKLLADLDSNSFETREAAVKRVKELGLQTEPALLSALDAKPSLEQRRRIEELLAVLRTEPPPSPQELRQLRALIVLEHIGTAEARRMLDVAAKGPPSARLTRQALAAWACLP